MRTFKLYGIIIMLVMSSCSKDDDVNTRSVLDCILEFEDQLGIGECDENENPFPNDACETISLGESKIEDSSKEYLVQACEDLNNTITYVNDEGESINMVVSKKSYKGTRTNYRSLQMCEDDSTKVIGYCLKSEFIVVRLKSENPEIQFDIKIQKYIDKESSEPGAIGDVLYVLRKKDTNSSFLDLKFILNKGTLDFENFPEEEFYESIEILGTEFTDVISFDNSDFQGARFKIYYNKTVGLIAFRDSNNLFGELNDN